MSVNLIYDHLNDDGEYISCFEFPFCSPTKLTREVLAAKSKVRQVEILGKYLSNTMGGEYMLESIRLNLTNPRIVLGET